MKFRVLLNVDGEMHEEEVNAPDAKLAISKALKLHPIKVEGVIPLEVQETIPVHEGQRTTDDFEERVGEEIAAAEGLPEAPEPVGESARDLAPVGDLDDVDPEEGEAA